MMELQEHINEEVKEVLDKHTESLLVANKEMGLIKETLIILQTDVAWLKKFFWIIAASSIGGLVPGIINLLLK